MRGCERAAGSTPVAGFLSLGTVTLRTGHPLQGTSCASKDASLVPTYRVRVAPPPPVVTTRHVPRRPMSPGGTVTQGENPATQGKEERSPTCTPPRRTHLQPLAGGSRALPARRPAPGAAGPPPPPAAEPPGQQPPAPCAEQAPPPEWSALPSRPHPASPPSPAPECRGEAGVRGGHSLGRPGLSTGVWG